jgi:DNA-binding transcriptional ArsR family regulator
MSNVFAALSQGSRLSVFRLLIEYGEEGLCASDISKKLKITKNTLSFHLLLLVNAGLLNKKREGTFIFYSANYKTVQEVIDFLIENCCRKTKDHKHKHRPLKALGQKAAKG